MTLLQAAGTRARLDKRTCRRRERGSLPTAVLTFSLLLLVMAMGFLFGRLVIAKAYVKTAPVRRVEGTAVENPASPTPALPAPAPLPDVPVPSEEGTTPSPEAGDSTDTAPAPAPPPAEGAADRNADQPRANAEPTPREVRFAIQVGAFASEQSARDAQAKLTRAGQAARIVPVREGTRSTYKVLVGRYRARSGAEDALSAVQARGFPEAFVVEDRTRGRGR